MKPDSTTRMSSPLPFRLLAIAGFAAAAGAGWHMAGGKSAAASTAVQTDTADQVKSAKTGSRTERSVRNAGPPSEAGRKIAAIRSIKSPQERMRATIALAYSLPASELGEWIDKRWFISEPGFDLTLFNKIVNQRWAAEDPQGKLKLALEAGEGYSSTTVLAWAKQDPAGVLAWLKENPNPSAENQALREIAKTDPALALKRLGELALLQGDGGWGNYYGSNDALQEIAKKSPAVLQAALDGMPLKMRRTAELLLLNERLSADPAGEVRALMQKPDGLRNLGNAMQYGENQEKIGNILLAQLDSLPEAWRKQISQGGMSPISENNAEKWFRADLEAAGFTESQAFNLRTTALSNLSYSKPELAIKLLGEISLDGPQRQSIIENLFSSGPDAEKQQELLASLTEEDRKLATDYLAKSGLAGGSRPDGELKVETPAEWFEAAKNYNPADRYSNSYYFTNAMSEWDSQKMAEFATEFRKLPDDLKKGAALVLAGDSHHSEGNRELRGEALRYLMTLPPPPAPEGTDPTTLMRAHFKQDYSYTASSFAVQWSMKDPDGASQWVQSLPEGDAKLWVQKNLATNWAKYDPDATNAWLGGLPAASRTEIEKFMKNPQQQQ